MFFILLLLLLLSSNCISKPVALQQLYVLSDKNIIRLKGFDKTGIPVIYTITRLPIYGTLFQLSHSFSNYGYDPIKGSIISNHDVIVSDKRNRIFYSSNTYNSCRMSADIFSFIVSNENGRSYESNITIVNKYGTIVCSDFLLDIDEWTITGNKLAIDIPRYGPYSISNSMNHYIYASDNKINIDKYGDSDKSLWYFNAPMKFLGNKGIAYGGFIKYSMSIFGGDIARLNYGDKYNLIELECSDCVSKILVYPLTIPIINISFHNNIAFFQIPLLETRGWVNNRRNKPTKCEFIQVLSRLSAIRIIGDITDWYEIVSLDNVFLTNLINQLPYCATIRPDTRICGC